MIPIKKTIAFLVLFFILSSGSAATGEAKNPLWRASSDKGAVYLLGSIHLLKSTDYPLSREIEKAFDSSEVVAFEIDIAESSTPAASAMVMEYGLFSERMSLKGSLSPASFREVERAFRDRSLEMRTVNALKPWYAATILTVTSLKALGFTPESGVDMHFYNKTIEQGKVIKALETLEYQLGLFNSMSMSDQEAFLLQSLSDLRTIEQDFPLIVKSWRSGDMKGIMKLLDSCRNFRDTCARIIDMRNRNWLPRIEELIQSGRPSMVIVGIAHMVGENGLLNLLRQKGYRVQQL